MAKVRAPSLRLVVDEAHEVDAVFGVLEQLARDELANVPGADDDGVLDIGEGSPGRDARHGAAGRDEQDPENPEEQHLRDARLHETSREPEDERAQRHEEEHAREVVERRVIRQELVAVVQAEELRRHYPDRQRGQEDPEFDPGLEGAVPLDATDGDTCEQEGKREPCQIGEQEYTSKKPPSVRRVPHTASPLQDLERSLVERTEDRGRRRGDGSTGSRAQR